MNEQHETSAIATIYSIATPAAQGARISRWHVRTSR